MKRMYLALGLLALPGCSSYSETFDCPAGQGVGCKSLSQVNQMVEKGELPYPELESQEASDGIKPRFIKTAQTDPLHLNADLMGAPKTSRIWLAGYIDQKGNYHGAHYFEPALKVQER